MNEIEMKDIPGYEGLYAATTAGRIWSYKRKIWLKPEIVHNGYYRVHLRKDKKAKHFRVNRLILMTFCPIEGMEKLDAGHLDEDKTNNSLDNLIWQTRKENINHGTRTARATATRWGKEN